MAWETTAAQYAAEAAAEDPNHRDLEHTMADPAGNGRTLTVLGLVRVNDDGSIVLYVQNWPAENQRAITVSGDQPLGVQMNVW